MFVKKLELLGFKTFADKIEIELSPGITAVVGPNGCGKSNIADALLWVLGESNVRNIRGQRNVDVIFSGSDKRRPLGMAEVSLTLDNTCGTLPLSFGEVTVTRRAFRSGEAEYFINKSRCRLKDIYELFLDTGIGREAYSMITQGEIDAVLSAKPEDRRELFEEAAGVKKYRYRRGEALRKLEKTEANLHRVRDIMSEISGQLGPLEEQAEQARRCEELQGRLREIEVGLLIRDLRRHSDALMEVREVKTKSAGEMERYDTLLSDLEWEKDKHNTRLQEIEAEVEDARRVQANLSATVQRLEGKAALLDERLNSAQASRSRTDEEIATFRRRIEETRERIERLEGQQGESSDADVRLREQAAEKTAAVQMLERRCEEASRSISDSKASYLELAKDLAAKRNSLANSQDRVSQLEAALRKYSQEIDALRSQRQQSEDASAEAVTESEVIAARIAELGALLASLAQQRASCSRKLTEIGVAIGENTRDSAARSSRLATLREMAEAHEGFYEGVRSVLSAGKTGKLAGEFAVVADVISVPKGCETALETALGASLQDVITGTIDEAKRAIQFLKDTRGGRATFLPLDGMRPPDSAVNGKTNSTGALGIAADLITYDRRYDSAIRSLLGRTVVADSIDSAVRLSRQLRGWNKIVTLEGELLVPSGAITGGAARSRGPGLLVRKREIESLNEEIAGLARAAAQLADERASAEEGLRGNQSQASEAEESLSGENAALAERQKRADFASREGLRLSRELQTIETEREEAETLLRQESEAIDRLQEQLVSVGQENSDLDRKVTGAEQEVGELQKQLAQAREESMRLQVALAGFAERSASLRAGLAEAQSSLKEFTEGLAARCSQVDGISVDVAGILEEKETVERECAYQRELLTVADNRLEQAAERRTVETEKGAKIDSEFREAGRMKNSLSEESHEASVREARLEVQVSQAAERLLEEYEVTVEEAMETADDVEVERGTATEVSRLRREIKEMGPVNTGAIQEYDRIRERWDFLCGQRSDLEGARDQINSAIEEIDANTHGLFMETFNSVAANFETIFGRLFGGGNARLSLTHPDNLLETGVDVTVQPPGKKLQDMALMSGGERALTATALVFALLMAKPSPFVVMDEVDAPLDESNVERFAEVLREFSANSQFIVITHNRATMEASDSLYGVTMQEPGISKILSVRLAAEGPVIEDEAPSGELVTA